ncbi:MAG: hypothetical protein Q9M19_01270 [Mariprofundaceae bacterium]|nr:hypothetical protein [Mariprofundaceae bacterium]
MSQKPNSKELLADMIDFVNKGRTTQDGADYFNISPSYFRDKLKIARLLDPSIAKPMSKKQRDKMRNSEFAKTAKNGCEGIFKRGVRVVVARGSVFAGHKGEVIQSTPPRGLLTKGFVLVKLNNGVQDWFVDSFIEQAA